MLANIYKIVALYFKRVAKNYAICYYINSPSETVLEIMS